MVIYDGQMVTYGLTDRDMNICKIYETVTKGGIKPCGIINNYNHFFLSCPHVISRFNSLLPQLN